MGGSDSNLDKTLNSNVLVARIVVGALTSGVVIFLGIVISIRAVGDSQPKPPIVGLVGVVFAAGALAAAAIVPNIMVRSWQRQVAGGSWPPQVTDVSITWQPTDPFTEDELDVLRWWSLYQTQLIIRCALVEGAAFFQCTAYLVEGNLFGVGIAGGLLVVLLSQWPSRERGDRWVATRLQAVEELQSAEVP